MKKFVSKIDVIYIPVRDNQGRSYQKPYLQITDTSNDSAAIPLRDDVNVVEFTRILMSVLDYNVISTSASFAIPEEVKNTENVSENTSPFTMD